MQSFNIRTSTGDCQSAQIPTNILTLTATRLQGVKESNTILTYMVRVSYNPIESNVLYYYMQISVWNVLQK